MPEFSAHIRTACAEDAVAIAKVHTDSWKSTYAGIVSDSYLRQIGSEKRTEAAIKKLANPQIDCFVAVNETGQVVGFADVGPSREKNLSVEAELYAIYLLKEYQKRGIGRSLFNAAVAQLRQKNFKDFFVSVLSENTGSVLFYQKMNGKHIGHDHVDIDGVRHKTNTYFWSLSNPTNEVTADRTSIFTMIN